MWINEAECLVENNLKAESKFNRGFYRSLGRGMNRKKNKCVTFSASIYIELKTYWKLFNWRMLIGLPQSKIYQYSIKIFERSLQPLSAILCKTFKAPTFILSLKSKVQHLERLITLEAFILIFNMLNAS